MSAAFMSALAKELAEERAQGLGRAEQIMIAALEKYRTLGNEQPADAQTDDERYARLWALTGAVASFVIQREACGLLDTNRVLKLYAIPAEVMARLGVTGSGKSTAC